MAVPSDRLRCGPEEDFIDIDVVRLADSKRDTPGECTRSDRNLADELPGARLDIFLADMLKKFGVDRGRGR
jgi:hypothetical protein